MDKLKINPGIAAACLPQSALLYADLRIKLEKAEDKYGSRRFNEAKIMAKRTPKDIFYWLDALDRPNHEIPYFDHGDWTVSTRHGLVWKIWPDERNNDPDLFNEALEATQEIIKTGQPLFGGWR